MSEKTEQTEAPAGKPTAPPPKPEAAPLLRWRERRAYLLGFGGPHGFQERVQEGETMPEGAMPAPEGAEVSDWEPLPWGATLLGGEQK